MFQNNVKKRSIDEKEEEMTKAAIVLANGFEPLEAIAPIDALRRGNVDVDLVSVGSDLSVCAAQDIFVKAEKLIDQVDLVDYDALIIPGGSVGVENLKKSDKLSSALRERLANDQLVCAICAGPTVLASLGLLEGRHATCYPGCEVEFPSNVYQKKDVVIDNNLITSEGPGTALKFGIEVLRALKGDQIADQVANSMLLNW